MPQFLPLGANSTVSVCTGGGQRIGFYPPLHSPLQQPLWSPVCVAFNPSVTAAVWFTCMVWVYTDCDSPVGTFPARSGSRTSACEQDWECPKTKSITDCTVKQGWSFCLTLIQWHIFISFTLNNHFIGLFPLLENQNQKEKKKGRVWNHIIISVRKGIFPYPYSSPVHPG